ncbi:lipase family protein [Streptomyces sp. NPDC050485]|uniref:lipase family protein n=1 Tax=Streptomyces sp. NPDC050485 TaxID=3365617 RepID=UPI0037A0DD5D
MTTRSRIRRSARGAFAALTLAVLSAMTVPPAAADACDHQCSVDRAWAQQRANALDRDAFYNVPEDLPWAPVGSLIRAEAAQDYQLDAGMRALRILYHSRDSRGRDVATSGVVVLPAGQAPAGGWPVLADAHGSSGVARDCAPSLMKNLWYGGYLRAVVRAGYALVATDYTGLGANGGPVEFLSKRAEAEDVVDALPAAREAVPELGRDWVALGHSQGGHAVLGVAELMARRAEQGDGDRGYRGGVAVAPASQLTELFADLGNQSAGAGTVALIVAGAGAGRRAPAPDDVLTPAAVGRLPVLAQGCLPVVAATYGDLLGKDLVTEGGVATMAPYLSRNEPGTRPVLGPLLIQQGTADPIVTTDRTQRLTRRLCALGQSVEYRVYQGYDHNGVLYPSLPDTLSWIADRFAGKQPPSTCS